MTKQSGNIQVDNDLMNFKLGDVVMAQYTITNEDGQTENITMGGVINKIDTNNNSCEVILNNKLIIWAKFEDIELVFSKENQKFVETVVNNKSRYGSTDISPEYKALKILLELENDNIRNLLYRELNKEVVKTMDNLVEGYEFDKVKSIVDAMKELVFD